MDFNPSKYGAEVARILTLDEDGKRLQPLHFDPCSSPESFASHATVAGEARGLLRNFPPAALFPSAAEPEAAMAGLWLYFFCFEEAHQLANDSKSADGTLWHAILHRLEGDMGNAAYWFRKAGHHPIYSGLSAEASQILRRYPSAEFRIGRWDPFAFISFCDRARRQPGSDQERAAMEIQRAEWQLLFDYSAIPQQGGRGSFAAARSVAAGASTKPSKIVRTPVTADLRRGPAQ
jgi:hypothetical protein